MHNIVYFDSNNVSYFRVEHVVTVQTAPHTHNVYSNTTERTLCQTQENGKNLLNILNASINFLNLNLYLFAVREAIMYG
jgi:hypothetical protein